MIATFMYMRILGYPAEKISILTTYNGQKHLIRDVCKQRCGKNPFIGFPHKVTHYLKELNELFCIKRRNKAKFNGIIFNTMSVLKFKSTVDSLSRTWSTQISS